MVEGANEWTSYETHEARARRLFVPAAEVIDTPGWDTPIDMNDGPDAAPAVPDFTDPHHGDQEFRLFAVAAHQLIGKAAVREAILQGSGQPKLMDVHPADRKAVAGKIREAINAAGRGFRLEPNQTLEHLYGQFYIREHGSFGHVLVSLVSPSPAPAEDPKTWVPKMAPPAPPQPVIDEARQIIHGARQSSHGAPERSFEAISGLWNAYLGTLADRNGVTFIPLKPYQVADLMELLKVARSVAGDPTHRDHYVDRIGYAALAHELVSKEAVS